MLTLSPETLDLLRTAIFLAVAVPVSAIDLRSRRIPDLFSLGGLAALFALDLAAAFPELPASTAASAFAFLLFALVRRYTRGLGFGDVKYAALVGYFSGIRLLPLAFFTAAACGLAYAFTAILLFGMPWNKRVPFGPFLSTGGLAAAACTVFGSGRTG